MIPRVVLRGLPVIRPEARRALFARRILILSAACLGALGCSAHAGSVRPPPSDGGAGPDTGRLASPDASISDASTGGDASIPSDGAIDPDASSPDAVEADDAEGSACAPGTPYGLGKCSYTVDLPCGATYPEELCHLLLTDCASVCASGYVTCEYTATACDDSGTLITSPPAPVTVQCNTSTSKICPP